MVNGAVVQVFRPGEWFAYDTGGMTNGDVMFCEVLEVVERFGDDVDRVGDSRRGYKVKVYSSLSSNTGVVDYYALDCVNETCVRLSPTHVEKARTAGWPHSRRWLRKLGSSE